MTRYRKYRNPYQVDVNRFSIYSIYRDSKESNTLSVGDEVIVKVNEVDRRGIGVTHYRGRKILVPRAMAGERVRVRIIKKLGNNEYLASVVERLSQI